MLDLLFNHQHIVLTVLGYPLSLLEVIGTVSGLACVLLTAAENSWCWPVGVVNLVFFFILFYQVQLYSDMLLQVIFMGFTLYGWWKWTHPHSPAEENRRHELRITRLSAAEFIVYLGISAFLTGLWGYGMSRVHEWMPRWFPLPAAFPYGDAFTTVFSVTASLLLARKKIESWIYWIIIDVTAVVIYYLKGIHLVALEYVVFGVIAAGGLLNWHREYRKFQLE